MALNKFFTPALLIALAAAQSVPVQAVDIDTAQILESTTRAIIADSCPQARPFGIGYCVWMTCTPVGCSVSTSIKYANYNPDAVVSAYHNTGKNPWTEMRVISTLTKEAMDELANATLDAMEGVFDTRLPFDIDFQGGNQTEAKGLEGENLVFKEADIFGHPWQMLGDPLISGTLACPTSSQSFMPYYQSILDMLAWRNPETTYFFGDGWASFVPGAREIGHGGGIPILGRGNTWGSVYPRVGMLFGSESPKTAAVIAQRAADIATRYGQAPHLYYPMPNGGATMIGGLYVWLPPSIREADPSTGKFQMLSPKAEETCGAFGVDDTMGRSWAEGRNTDKGTGEDFVWALWRPYKCCRRRGHFLIEERDWESWP